MLWERWLAQHTHLSKAQFLEIYKNSAALIFTSTWENDPISDLKDTPERTALPHKTKRDTRWDLFKNFPQQPSTNHKVIHFLQNKTQVGRAASADIQISLHSISRHQAEFFSIPSWDAWAIIDLCSKNGTFINDKKLSPALPYHMEQGMVISFGKEISAVYYTINNLWELAQSKLSLIS